MAVGQILPSPSINILFKTLATTAIQRSALGILCMVVKDTTWTGDKWVTLKTIADISQDDVDAKTYSLILLANKTYVPGKILIRFQGKTEDVPGTIVWEDIADILKRFNKKTRSVQNFHELNDLTLRIKDKDGKGTTLRCTGTNYYEIGCEISE